MSQPDLENLVRPFTHGNGVLPRARTYWNGTPQPPLSTTEANDREGVLTWSARADVEVTTLPGMNVRMNSDDDNNLIELSRDTSTRRITNPEDPEQYVDVEVINSLTLTNKAKQKRIFTLNNGES